MTFIYKSLKKPVVLPACLHLVLHLVFVLLCCFDHVGRAYPPILGGAGSRCGCEQYRAR
eukprot:COSAG06_NODE_36021_length_446_cov_4.036827_1_plen_58_part_10